MSIPTAEKILLAVLIGGSCALAQEALRPQGAEVPDTAKQTSLGFERVLNTFLWNGNLVYAGDINGLRFSTQQSVRSRLIRAEQQSIQDEYLVRVFAERSIAPKWRIQTQLYSSALADNRLLDLGRLSQHQGLAGLRFDVQENVALSALGGYEYNAQGDEQDAGFSYLLRGRLENIQFESFTANVQARASQSSLAPREQRDDSVLVNLDRRFGSDALNTLTVKFHNQKREFYTAADTSLRERFNIRNNIFSRSAQVLEIADSVYYAGARNIQLTLAGGILNRTIDRGFRFKDFSSSSVNAALDNRVNEFQLVGSLEMKYRLHRDIVGMFEIAYKEREETHEVVEHNDVTLNELQRQESAAKRLGNISRHTMIRSAQAMDISEKDKLNFVGSASILRYDTPDTLNIDDRDELLLSFGVEATHTANRYLRITLAGDVVLNHLVYLHRLQSANNNWNRIFRFSSRVEYSPARWFTTMNSAEVLANYTAYDFEDQLALVRSFSFRQASWSDSSIVRLTRVLALEFSGTVRVYERGILRWEEFKERPQNYFLEQSYWPQLTMEFGERLRAGIGYRYFSQNRYKYVAGERVFERRLETSGPTVFLLWYAVGYHHLSVQGWRETQQEEGRTIRTIPNVFMKIGFAL